MEVYLLLQDRFPQQLGGRWSLKTNKQSFSDYLWNIWSNLLLLWMQDVHVHVAGSRTGAAGFVRMDGRVRFKEG